MEYTLKVSALSGDIVSLMAVAQAMALRDATAGGTPFHKPMYDGRYHGYIRDLLTEVQSGRLQVCNAYGNPIAIDQNVDATSHFGYAIRYQKEPDWRALRKTTPPLDLYWEAVCRDWKTVRQPGLNEPDWEKLQAKWKNLRDALPNTPRWKTLCKYWQELLLALSPLEAEWHHGFWSFSHIDLGPKETDKDTPNNFWCTKLHILNLWAAKRGDSFTISHDGVGWIDERGWHAPITDTAQRRESTDGVRVPNNRTQSNWIESAKEIALRLKNNARKHLTLNKLARLVHDEMEKKHANNEPGMTGRGGRIPSAETIVRHAFRELNKPH